MLVLAKDDEASATQVYSCGLNNYGQLGYTGIADRLTEISFFHGMNIKQIAGGEHFSLCLDSTGKKLYGFGRTCSGQLGNTTTTPAVGSYEVTPVPIYLEYNADGSPKANPIISQISCGGSHSFAMTEHGDVYSWGFGLSGALGVGKVGDGDCVLRPQKIDVTRGINLLNEKEGKGLVSATVQMVAGGAQHSAMVATLHPL
jgi:alpha-tubulin suppressor-like RCC1 family protein